MNWLIEIQKWLYGGMLEGMKATSDISSLPELLSAAFLFGMVHALMPGHGKSVLVSYHLGRPGRLIEGLTTGTLLALTHVGTAIVFVLAGIAVISRSLAAGGRAPAFETMSAALITAIGHYLVVTALMPKRHAHSQDGKALAIFAGLVPCPLTTFILTFAIAQNKLAIGFAAVLAMMAGIIVTLVSFALAAIVTRGRFMLMLNRTEHAREHIAFWLELAGAIAVLALGGWMLADRLRWF